MSFWILSFALIAGIAALILRAMGRGGTDVQSNADLSVYRDQLAEVDRDAARGVIDAGEAERARVEISRRILDADRAGSGATQSARGGKMVPAMLLVGAIAAAVGLYLELGAPGYPDLPIAERIARADAFRAGRPLQAQAVAEANLPAGRTPDPAYGALLDKLRAAVANNPEDAMGQRLLARNEAALGNYAAASVAQEKLVALLGKDVTAADYATLADIYILATGGYVSPEAETALTEALQRDPRNGTGRFYLGLMWAQTGRPDLAFLFWRPLLEEGPEDAPWIPLIRAQIGLVAEAAGVNYTPPETLSGPSADDVAAAADMTPEERQAMIRGMVEGLADRLVSEGGTAEEWARLIIALSQLGEADRAKSIWLEAQDRFAGHEADLSTLRSAAERAGIAE